MESTKCTKCTKPHWLPVWELQQDHEAGWQGKAYMFFFLFFYFNRENSHWIAVWEIIKSLLCWCAVTWLIWIDYQLISDMSFTKTLILWQQLNSSPVELRYRVCSTQSSEWFSQLTVTDPFVLTSILLSVFLLVTLPLTPKRSFPIMHLLSTSAAMTLHESMLPLLNNKCNDHSYRSSKCSCRM